MSSSKTLTSSTTSSASLQSNQPIEFVKGWLLLDTLGEGKFGEVKLLMNKDNHEMVAVKVLIIKSLEMDKQIKKEICIHRNLQHDNIIAFYGNRRDDNVGIEYLFLEYAQNGELFEQIEPDIGMERPKAFKFFSDLLNGIEYIHQRGIVHRDIKPENILLDSKNQLKISDFGMATLFRHNGKERLLTQICGSVPYIAPEVLSNLPHRAEPLDIWSCGIVLVAMLSGELPWSEATNKNDLFFKWINGKFNLHLGPWCKIDTITLSLVKSILNPDPKKRMKLNNIKSHKAFKQNHSTNQLTKPNHLKRFCNSNGNGFASQPQIIRQSPRKLYNCDSIELDRQHHYDIENIENDSRLIDSRFCFSQPNRIQDMFLSTQTQMELGYDNTQLGSGNNSATPPGTRLYLQIVKRMTRFWSKKNFQKTCEELEKQFDLLNWNYKRQESLAGNYKISMTDRNRIPLVFRCSVNDMSSHGILIDFRLSKGDGIEFKRKFLILKNQMKSTIKNQQI